MGEHIDFHNPVHVDEDDNEDLPDVDVDDDDEYDPYDWPDHL